MAKRLDLTGQKFGKLTVVEFSHVGDNGKTCWKCICDCGKEITTIGARLKFGSSTSCGCSTTGRIMLDRKLVN